MTTSSKRVEKIKPEPTERVPDKEYHPLLALREEVDQLFDRFFSNVSFGRFGQFGKNIAEIEPLKHLEDTFVSFGKMAPRSDVSENGKSYNISVELPGMSESDIDISLSGDVLTISGEKIEKKKEEKENCHLSERRYGSVVRSFRIPQNVDADSIKASFDNGVLKIEMMKLPEAQTSGTRKIKISK